LQASKLRGGNKAMTAELEELLAAAKVMAMTNTVIEMERLHRAITAFEAVGAQVGDENEFADELGIIAAVLRKTDAVGFCRGYITGSQDVQVKPIASDPYDFENDGLRKEP
jgi:hypothetical protein